MASTKIVTDQSIPAKLIFEGREIDVIIEGHAYEENICFDESYYGRRAVKSINYKETFTCTMEYDKYF